MTSFFLKLIFVRVFNHSNRKVGGCYSNPGAKKTKPCKRLSNSGPLPLSSIGLRLWHYRPYLGTNRKWRKASNPVQISALGSAPVPISHLFTQEVRVIVFRKKESHKRSIYPPWRLIQASGFCVSSAHSLSTVFRRTKRGEAERDGCSQLSLKTFQVNDKAQNPLLLKRTDCPQEPFSSWEPSVFIKVHFFIARSGHFLSFSQWESRTAMGALLRRSLSNRAFSPPTSFLPFSSGNGGGGTSEALGGWDIQESGPWPHTATLSAWTDKAHVVMQGFNVLLTVATIILDLSSQRLHLDPHYF